MSAAQHSAGPWWVAESGIRNRAGYICFTRPATRFEGQDERFARESAERAGDNVLIAAAPDLLALAQRLEPWLTAHEAREIESGYRQDASQFLIDLRAAIDKATGGAA